MVNAFLGLHQHVVDIGLQRVTQHNCEQLVHHPLVCGSSIDEPKGITA